MYDYRDTTTLFELVRNGPCCIAAVPYQNGRKLKPVILNDGAIVERPTPEQMNHFPKSKDGSPGTLHVPHLEYDKGKPLSADRPDCEDDLEVFENLLFVGLVGSFVLPDGRVADVYGCKLNELGSSTTR